MRKTVFWGSLGLILYSYVGFPILVVLRGLLRQRPVRMADIAPSVSLVIAAYNEESRIADRINNALALEYPREQLEIVIASDGSTDKTNEIVASFADTGVRFLPLQRQGKIPVLNTAVAETTGEILLFSDATTMFAPDALRILVRSFADPEVGAVGGRQLYVTGNASGGASIGERLYWNFDRLLKLSQSKSGSMIAAGGAMYALRRELFRPIPVGVLDDHVISTLAIAQGYRLVFEPNALAYQTIAANDTAEFRRKVRVIVQGLYTLWTQRELFNPLRYGFYSVQLFSHKLLRWSVAWPLIVLAVVSPSLYPAGRLYKAALQGQLLLYGCAVSALLLRRTRFAQLKMFKLLAIPYYFCMVNYAALCAWMQLLSGKRVVMWDSTKRAADGE